MEKHKVARRFDALTTSSIYLYQINRNYGKGISGEREGEAQFSKVYMMERDKMRAKGIEWRRSKSKGQK
jgi:hypothetical protein